MENELRKSLTDLCDIGGVVFTNAKKSSRNAKSRNNVYANDEAGTISNCITFKSGEENFKANLIKEEEKIYQVHSNQALESKNSLSNVNEGKSFFLNKVKITATTNQKMCSNFATQSTAIT
jgi:hypothetical protein